MPKEIVTINTTHPEPAISSITTGHTQILQSFSHAMLSRDTNLVSEDNLLMSQQNGILCYWSIQIKINRTNYRWTAITCLFSGTRLSWFPLKINLTKWVDQIMYLSIMNSIKSRRHLYESQDKSLVKRDSQRECIAMQGNGRKFMAVINIVGFLFLFKLPLFLVFERCGTVF